MKTVKEIYKNYDKRTIEYMEMVVDQIKSDYKIVPSSWRVSLDLIAQTLEIYWKSLDDINKNGIFKTDDRGRISKNQSVAIQNVCLQNIYKLLSAFCLTPMSKSRLKQFDGDESANVYDDLMNC